jgi:hypothetical protein
VYNHRISLKLLSRHVLLRMGLDRARIYLHEVRGLKMDHLKSSDPDHIFTDIYKQGIWLERPDQDSQSGLGSSSMATAALRSKFSEALRVCGCRALLDVGCGDFNWMRDIEGDWDYTGIDVVPHIVERNNALYATASRRFVAMDAIRESLPTADTVLCRDILFHLSFNSISRVIANAKRSGAKYLIATTDSCTWFNAEIRDGDYRPVNLRRPPFRLPQPIMDIDDSWVADGQSLGVWLLDEIP